MLSGLWTGGYSRMTREEVISQLPCDDKSKQVLAKKLKGANYDTDKRNLIAIGGVDDELAEQYAYFISEAAVWESFTQLMDASGRTRPEEIDEILKLIDGAIVVEETPKVAFELLPS
jgi:hypothetical protein